MAARGKRLQAVEGAGGAAELVGSEEGGGDAGEMEGRQGKEEGPGIKRYLDR